jgi:hypothetical protein
MPRRPATITQSDLARAVRAARQAGAHAVEVRKDGTMVILLEAARIVPEQLDDTTTPIIL